MCARIGDVVEQDKAYTIQGVLKLVSMFETKWTELGMGMTLESICACVFLLLTCLGVMRGYEVVWTDLDALWYDVAYCESMDDYSAVSWPIVGRFKAHDGVVRCYMILIAGATTSGITFFTWTHRFICRLGVECLTNGWAFRRPDGTRALAGDYRNNIFSKLETILEMTTLVDPECKIWDAYGI